MGKVWQGFSIPNWKHNLPMSPGASYHSRHYHIEGLLCMGWQGRRGVTKAYGKVSRITLEPFTYFGTVQK